LLELNNIELTKENELVRLRSVNTESTSDWMFDIEADGDQIRWLSICRGITCHSYYPLPEDPAYWLKMSVTNFDFYQTGELGDGTFEEYREQTKEFLTVFDSFKVSS